MSKKNRIRIFLTLTVILGVISSSFIERAPIFEDGPVKTIIIDAGHGGKDPGSLGSKYKEKEITLKVAKQLKRIFKEYYPKVKVVMTRESDTFVELHKRADIGQTKKGDFFISIHCDANKNKSAYGTTSYVAGVNKGQEDYETIMKENEAVLFEDNYKKMYGGFDPKSAEADIYFSLLKNAHRHESMRLAKKIQGQFKSRVGRKSRGVKQAPFIVLWQSGLPSVLVEIGFISNKKEETYLASKNGQVYLASGIYRAVKEYNIELAKK